MHEISVFAAKLRPGDEVEVRGAGKATVETMSLDGATIIVHVHGEDFPRPVAPEDLGPIIQKGQMVSAEWDAETGGYVARPWKE